MTAPVVLEGVSRRYGATVALDGVDLALEPGSLTGLLGPNGAGKSTLVNLVAGLRRADSGTVRLFGGDPRDAANRVALGTTPQQTGLPETLRVGEVLRLVSGHFPDPVPTGELLERFGLAGLERRQTGGLSGGQKRRLAVALAFCGRPRLVLLDEPTTGLDVEGRRVLWDAVREFHAGGGTVLLTTHYLDEIETLAERVVVLSGGRIRADGDVDTIRGAVRRSRVTLRAALLPDLPGIEHTERDGDRWVLHTADADALVRDLVTSGAAFSDLGVARASLEEAFLTLAGTGPQADPAVPTGGSR
ncbi:ABC-2 type transport system ATP-binding protein [Pseudonocardia ammonioxydans]|uniref:ABC-2 type transport system ATP-binding protein n=1 Tax=Pseudonocardia ammonioxydans TaxID=260086 RepID=A0A1I4WRL0_PSUAM|nr:ABC transporter ATP-binding protein [Pseudonocardia ammonioxydans]SFN15760.1 ABC-2 type transport system ATP-binding protein [Pseudonocardia ammonioxydans]